MLGFGMQWSVDGNDVAHSHERLDRGVIGDVEFLLDRWRKPVPVGVVQSDVKWL